MAARDNASQPHGAACPRWRVDDAEVLAYAACRRGAAQDDEDPPMADELSDADIAMDTGSLYKEETFTDRRVGTLQRLDADHGLRRLATPRGRSSTSVKRKC